MSRQKKVAAIHTDYAKEQYARFQQQNKQIIFRRRRLAVVFLVALVIFGISGFRLVQDHQELQAREADKIALQKEAETVSTQKAALEKEVALLKDDDYIAKLARSKYLLSKDNEQIYPISESQTESQTSLSTDSSK